MLRVILRTTAVVVLLGGLTQAASHVHGAQASAENAVIGTLAGYEAKTRVLTVKVEKVLQIFVLADNASVHLGSKVLPASQIAAQIGHKVKIRYTESGGKRLANSVMLSPAP